MFDSHIPSHNCWNYTEPVGNTFRVDEYGLAIYTYTKKNDNYSSGKWDEFQTKDVMLSSLIHFVKGELHP